MVTTLSEGVKTRNTLSRRPSACGRATSRADHPNVDAVIIVAVATRSNQTDPSHHSAQRQEPRPRIVVVAGPTAVGKTALGIGLAEEFDGEVVNADSRYLYRGFDIGVAKPDIAERQGIPHHLIDILPPDGDMTLARYQDLALEAIAEVVNNGKLSILVGGTPLYINAVVEGWNMPRVPPNPSLRTALETEAGTRGIATLAKRLGEVDPAAAERCGGNLRRIIRALEVYEATGMPMS